MSRQPRAAIAPRAPHVVALHRARGQNDVSAAMLAFDRAAADEVDMALPEYNLLLSMLGEHGERAAASRVREHMRRLGVEPDDATVTLEVRSLVGSGEGSNQAGHL